ncbi:hypothetical protein ANN_11511 [Periplaneta americana]|uniref:Uncharacterized protein n=1 Tax=Periplaneta americana TaxID=6978 RepID=A0ABQ8T5W8_PERAM|nr:hypothetical protein ANN_11511 [Periplaneta americana]
MRSGSSPYGGKKFSHEISVSVWDQCPPSIVKHLGELRHRHSSEGRLINLRIRSYCWDVGSDWLLAIPDIHDVNFSVNSKTSVDITELRNKGFVLRNALVHAALIRVLMEKEFSHGIDLSTSVWDRCPHIIINNIFLNNANDSDIMIPFPILLPNKIPPSVVDLVIDNDFNRLLLPRPQTGDRAKKTKEIARQPRANFESANVLDLQATYTKRPLLLNTTDIYEPFLESVRITVVVITEDVQNVHLLLEYRPHIDVSLTCEHDPKLQEYCVCPQNMPQFNSEGIPNQAPETNKPMILNGPTSRNREGSDQVSVEAKQLGHLYLSIDQETFDPSIGEPYD